MDASEAKRKTEDTKVKMYDSLTRVIFQHIEAAISSGEYTTRVSLNPMFDMPHEVIEAMELYNYLNLGRSKLKKMVEFLESKQYTVEFVKACPISMSPPALNISWV